MIFGNLDVVGNILGASRNPSGGGGNVLRITTASPLDAMVDGTVFSQTLQAAGGSEVYVDWQVVAGALPTGLSLNAGSGAITGTPTTPATGSVTITVEDDAGAIAGKPFDWTVTEAFMLLTSGDFFLLVSGPTDKLALVAA